MEQPLPSDHATGAIPPRERMAAAERLSQAFDRWRALDKRLAEEGPRAVSMEEISAAWTNLLQRHEEWSNSR